MSLSVNVKFMWDDSGATARLEDFFMVRAVHGDWGVPTDSGSLVLGSDQAAGTTHRPVVGLYWGAFDAELSGRRRNVGLACRMDRVAEQLGVGPLGAAPLLAFADWLYGHRRPLDFLKLRRVPGLRVRMRRGRAAQLVAEIMRRRWAQSLRTPLLRHGHRIVAALARCADLRRGMTRVLGPLLSGKSSPKAVFAHVPTRGERAMLAALLASLAALHPGLRSAMRNAGAAVSDAGNETVGDILRGVDAARRRNPGALHQRRARRVQRSM